MPQVLAWQSADGQLFTDKTQYQRHQRRLAAQRRRDRLAQDAEQHRAQFLAAMAQVCSVADLTQFIHDHWSCFTTNAARHGREFFGCKVWPTLQHLEFADLFWHHNVSNSHSAPADGKTNWWRHDDQPLGYPGWKGRLRYSVSNPRTYRFASDFFKGTPIHTGSGGVCESHAWAAVHRAETAAMDASGQQTADREICHYEYDVTLWSADWPGLTQTHEKQVMWDTLSASAPP
jgi:hypothetical protein